MYNSQILKRSSPSIPLVASALLVSSCALLKKEPVAPETLEQMARMYECVWFHHLAGDEVKSEALIDDVILVGEEAGMEGGEIMGVYSQARSRQREIVAERAQELAQARGPAVSRIMQDFGREPVEPNEEDNKNALLVLYREQCTSE